MASVEYVDPSPRRGRGPRHEVVLLDSFRNPSRIAGLADAMGVPYPIAATILSNKANDTIDLDTLAAPYLAEGLPEHPLLTWDETAAAASAVLGLPPDSPIGLYGDYDADGVTSVLILREALRLAGHTATVEDFSSLDEEGFGLSSVGLGRIVETGCRFLFVLDTGTNSEEALAEAVAAGLGVCVIDHHPLTDGRATMPGVLYLNQHLRPMGTASITEPRNAGLAWYFGLALLRAAGASQDALDAFHGFPLALAALGTSADAGKASEGPHNRWLLRQGFQPAPLSLVPSAREVFGTDPERIPLDVAEPRIAEGFRRLSLGKRMKTFSPATVLRALDPEATDEERRSALAEMDARYAEFEASVQAGTEWLLANDRGEDVLVAAVPAKVVPHEHTGISGTLASKVAYQTGRPAIVFIRDADGTLKGSWRMARTGVDGERLVAAVSGGTPGIIVRYGGHAPAGGVLLPGRRELPFFEALILQEWGRIGGPAGGGGRRWPASSGEVRKTFVSSRWVPERDGADPLAVLDLMPFSRYELRPPAFLSCDMEVASVSGGKERQVVAFAHPAGTLRCRVPARASVPLVGSVADAVLTPAWDAEEEEYVLVAEPIMMAAHRMGSFD